jgi:hypothetical protein
MKFSKSGIATSLYVGLGTAVMPVLSARLVNVEFATYPDVKDPTKN